jgi:uncharacterized protein YhaN
MQMQIRELEIDRFGVWQDVSFPFNERGVTVLYGPNETGKSTLLRFIRGVLYGFQPEDERTTGPNAQPVECSGQLRIRHQGQDYRLRRTSQPGTRGRLEINGRIVRDDDRLLKTLTGEIPESIFQNIFAIGLQELQQLATLNGDELAHHIYGLSLGPEGEQIFAAHAGLADEERRLIGKEAREGEVTSLLQQLARIDAELARHGPLAEKHSQLLSRLNDVEDQIDEKKDHQSALQHDLRGRRLLTRIWAPWNKERDLSRQIEKLPRDDIDRTLLKRFDDIEAELAGLDEQRQSLIGEARQLQQDAEAIPTRPELEQHACRIQNLFERSHSMQMLQRTLQDPQSGADARTREVNELLTRLDGRWDLRRLEQSEITSGLWHRLLILAQGFRQARGARHRLIKRYKQQIALHKKLRTAWKAHTRELGDLSPDDARKALEKRIHDIEELRGLRVRRDHLHKTLNFLSRDLGPRTLVRELPPSFWLVLWFFVFSGIVLVCAGGYAAFHGYDGIVAGRATAWIAGGCFAFLGLSAMGTFWAMKEYFETVEFDTSKTGEEIRNLQNELHRVEQAIERITRRDAPPTPPGPQAGPKPAPPTDDEQLRQLRERLLQLDQFEPLGRRLDVLRRRMSSMRSLLQDRQRKLSHARRDWIEALRRIGITETLKISQAFEQCQLLAEAHALLQSRRARLEREEYQRHELEGYLRQVRELGELIEGRAVQLKDPHQSLADWDKELQQQAEHRRERARLRQLVKEKRIEAGRLQDQLEKKRRERSSLLKRLGAGDRGEIAIKLAAIDERNTLEHQLKEIREELHKLAAAEPDLAIVEDDLLNYDAEENQQHIDRQRYELEQLERALQQLFDTLGTLKEQLREIEDDRTLTSLRFDREQAAHALREVAEKWCAIRLADKVVDQLRHRIEEERQPSLLLDSSESLRRLTCHKYQKIWTRLGEKALFVDDENGQSLRVEQLSSGTREQVFLSVRLAMIKDFARQGIELPLVLDDVTVNFDQSRTEAAVQTLSEVASSGQQIMLLTCHLHLAQLFQDRGLEPIWLPALREAQYQH